VSSFVKSSGLLIDGRLFVAVKVAAFFPQRPGTLGLPSIVGLIQLFDGETGQPLAVMESALNHGATHAAGTAAALDQLAPGRSQPPRLRGRRTSAAAHRSDHRDPQP
jgi:ornithine cyclodeaminase/alanine dehydrogenase-like protein (mu-crystallin family)